MELQNQKSAEEDRYSLMPVHPRNERQHDFSGTPAQAAYQYYMSGAVNQVMMSSSAHVYQKNLHDMQNHATTAIMPQYNHLPHCPPHVNGMASFPYYPVSICLQPGQMPNTHSWPSFGNSSSTEVNPNKVDRREAALIKFRQKRKERCFDKKIRYVNRKRLAERRPRVRGQFVRKLNGVNVDLNGEPASVDDDEEEDEKDDEEFASGIPPRKMVLLDIEVVVFGNEGTVVSFQRCINSLLVCNPFVMEVTCIFWCSLCDEWGLVLPFN
ncbi:two-component response regulator-like APRR1 [Prunus yedoensis var. nudiflora]|uniref:Two-component response regulator-like APRR1 n=1 Tax=Prunus yedoensis var. nudiflora TaxID=2094558 RepID=A0A314ZT95_PRUYE|nr:two-component response regulator-like APRR1 [Prunus yedoensis var. nudiflora]